MASSLMIVAMNKDGPSKRGVRGNVNTFFVGEDVLRLTYSRMTIDSSIQRSKVQRRRYVS